MTAVRTLTLLASTAFLVARRLTLAVSSGGSPGKHGGFMPRVPPPLLRWQDYNGPFERLVGVFGRNRNVLQVHPPHYKPGAVLCSLETREKFALFVHDTLDPYRFSRPVLTPAWIRLPTGIAPTGRARLDTASVWRQFRR